MKKLLIGLLALGSVSVFAADVCLIQLNRFGTTIACGDKPSEKVGVGGSAAKHLGEKLTEGYKIVNVSNSEGSVLYTLIKN
jgi:hypothetical protein